MGADTDELGKIAAELCANLELEGPPVTYKHVAEMYVRLLLHNFCVMLMICFVVCDMGQVNFMSQPLTLVVLLLKKL